jgi:hypothetical protein
MDHLPSPLNPYQRVQIPYLGGEEYDNLGFSGFPERQGWTIDQLSSLLGSSDGREIRGKTISNALAFVQSWLYFGTLHDVFRLNGITINKDDYIEKDGHEGKMVMTSERLPSHVVGYLGIETSLSDAARLQHRQWVVEFLITVCGKVWNFDNIESQRSHDMGSQDTRGSVLFSVMVLCTSLSSLLCGSTFTAGPSRFLSLRMCREGWCPNQVAMISDTFFEASRHYIYLLGPPQIKKDHRGCSERVCAANQVDEGTYETKHLQTDCICEPVEPNLQMITSISESGGIPLISLSPLTYGSHFDCCVEEFKPGMIYVAISHVWSDGLGNVNRNSLPLCQMRALKTRASAILSTSERTLGGRTYLWIDTLCVPLSPASARNAAILTMRRTYASATRVLVLDAELMSIPRPPSALETRMRIVTSAWYSRLWTFQEGVLGRSLHFQFENEAASGQELYEDEKRSEEEKLAQGVSNKHLVWSYPRSTILGYSSLATEEGKVTLLEGLRWRSTTKIRDEPICIAVLLNLDLAQIMTYPKDERFKAMLWFQKIFRLGMLFYNGPRIAEYRYRWAPRSFMAHGDPIPFGEIPASFTWHSWGYAGLTFRSVGVSFGPVYISAKTTRFKLAIPWENSNKSLLVTFFGDPSSNFLKELVDSGKPVPLALIPSGLIFGQVSNERPPTTGALVIILKKEDILFARFICCVWMTRSMADDEKSDYERLAGVETDRTDVADLGAAEIVPYQWWCVG